MSYTTYSTWEYKCLAMPEIFLQDLNALGSEGWELVAVEDGMFFFKRGRAEVHVVKSKRSSRVQSPGETPPIEG